MSLEGEPGVAGGVSEGWSGRGGGGWGDLKGGKYIGTRDLEWVYLSCVGVGVDIAPLQSAEGLAGLKPADIGTMGTMGLIGLDRPQVPFEGGES